MVDSSNLNGYIAAADDLEKADGHESDEDLEKVETFEAEEDLEKGEEYQTEEPELLESLLTPQEAQHQELAAASKPLILTEKIVVSLLVVCFVLVEAYFVGVSFRDWLDDGHHQGNSNLTDFVTAMPTKLPLSTVGTVKDCTPEPFEDFEGGLNPRAPARDFEAVAKLPQKRKSDSISPQKRTLPMKNWFHKMIGEGSPTFEE